MSDSPPNDGSGKEPTEATKEPAATAPADPPNDQPTPPAKAESSASGALDDAAKAMDAAVKSDVPATAVATEPAKIEPPKADAPKPVVEVFPLPATTSGMHQQYVAPGVARQSFLQSTKWQLTIFGVCAVFAVWVLRPSGSSDFLGIGGGGNTTTTGGIPNGNDTIAAGGTNPNLVPTTPPPPQADFTVNAAAIGDTAMPLPRTRPDGGTQNKGGYAEEAADLDAAEAMIAKDPVRALQMVDQHDTDYPRAMLDPTARVIRVEAYAKKGDDAKALGLGNEFLEDYPHSPRAGTVMAIVEALKNKLDAGHP